MAGKALMAWLSDESGAVTIDWVVLSAAVIALGVAIITQMSSSTHGVATALGTSLSGATVRELDFD